MKWLETWNYELASPTGPLASLCYRVRNKLLKNCSGYHTMEENTSVTAAKAFLKSQFGGLSFRGLSFQGLSFRGLRS